MNDGAWRWVEIVGTLLVPTAVFTFGSRWLSPTGVLLAGLAPALAVAIGGMVREGRPSALSLLALASVLVTGGIGLLQLDPAWFALKEMLVPAAIGAVLAGTGLTGAPAIGVLLGQVLDKARLADALAAPGAAAGYARAVRAATFGLGGITAASGVVSATLAWVMVHSPPGTEAFTTELGRYTGWSVIVVTVPTLAANFALLRWALGAIEAAVQRPLDELLPAA